MRTIGAITIVALSLAALAESSAQTSETSETSIEALVKRAIGTIEMKPDWEQIEVDKRNPYNLHLYYHSPHYFDVESDVVSIARPVLSAIVASGKKPDWVYVYAVRRTKGESGQDLIQSFGYVFYNPRDDGLHYCQGRVSADDSKCHRVPRKD